MTSCARIFFLAHRFLIARFFKVEDFVDFIFWPLLDIIIWAGVGLSLAKKGASSDQVTLSVLSVVMMRVFLYSYFNTATNFLYEMMARNIINLFSTPITFTQWLCGAMISGCISTILLVLFATAVARILFGIALMSAGPGLIIFVIPLLISGWAIAHITIVVLMIFGVHAQRLAWVIGWLFVPFSGVYYSLDIMPVWMQNISTVVPMSYIFNALRIFIIEGHYEWALLSYGYGFASIYFIGTFVAVHSTFARCRRSGLASLERS